MAEFGVPLDQNIQTSIPQLRNIVAEIAKVQNAVTEIKTTTKFIQKRLDQQDERNKQINNRHENTDEDFTEIFKKNLLELEKKDAEQSDNIKQLISSVSQLSEKVTSLCEIVEVSNVSPRQQDGLQSDAQQTDNHGDKTSISLNGEEQDVGEPLKRKTTQVSTDNRLTPPSNVEKSRTPKNQKQNIQVESRSVQKHKEKQREKENRRYNQQPKTNVISTDDLDSGKLSSHFSSRVISGKDKSTDKQTKTRPTDDEKVWLKLIDEEISKGKSLNLPQGRGPRTVLLIETSSTVAGEPLKKIKSLCNTIITCIEDIAINDNIEENLAVVTFGKEIKMCHYLTNDYDSVRACIDGLGVPGGPSPLLAGLFVSERIIKKQESQYWSVKDSMMAPRIILMTNGHATDSCCHGDIPDEVGVHNKTEIEEQITQFCAELRRLPITCVPVGANYNEPLLKSIAEASHGKFVLPVDVQHIGRFYKNVEIAVTIQREIPKELQSVSDVLTRHIRTTEDVTDADIAAIKYILAHPCITWTTGSKETKFITTDQEKKVGMRVERGPDWRFQNKDSGGPGTVVGFTEDEQLLVEWDNRERGAYQMGNGINHVKVSDKPRFLHNELIAVGCIVQRGKHWRYGNQDGGPDNIGVVIEVKPTGIVSVKWTDGGAYTYKFGFRQIFEVEVCDPSIVKYKALQNKPASSDEEEICGDSKSGKYRSRKLASKQVSKSNIAPPTVTAQSDTEVSATGGESKSRAGVGSKKPTAKSVSNSNIAPPTVTTQSNAVVSETGGESKSGAGMGSKKPAAKSVTAQSNAVVSDYQLNIGNNSVNTPSKVRDAKSVGSNILDKTVSMKDENKKTGHNVPEQKKYNPQINGDNLQMTGGDKVQMVGENMQITGDNVQMVGENMQMTGDNVQMKGDNLPVISGNLPEIGDKIPVIGDNLHAGDNIQVTANHSKVTDHILTTETVNEKSSEPKNNIHPYNENKHNGDKDRVNVMDMGLNRGNEKLGEPSSSKVETNVKVNIQSEKGKLMTTPYKDNSKQEKHPENVLSASDGARQKMASRNAELDLVTERSNSSLSHRDLSSASSTKEKGQGLSTDTKKDEFNFLPQPHQNVQSGTDRISLNSSQTGIHAFSPVRSNDNQELRFDRPGHMEDSDMFSETASVVSDISTIIQSCGIWEWKSSRGTWIPYNSAACQKIEKAYRRPKKSTALVEVDGELYRVVVSKMIHIHTKSRQMASIRRRDIDG